MNCPQCGSEKVYRSGFRYMVKCQVQRWLCRSCGYRFSDFNVKVNILRQVSEASGPAENHTNGCVTDLDFSSEKVLNGLSFAGSKDVGSHSVSVTEKGLNPLCIYNRERRVCASAKAKNLEEQEQIERPADGTTQNQTL